MQTDTPEALLEAVGYDASKLLDHRCRYTGPALGTPELDAILWVEGQRWFLAQEHTTKRDIVKNIYRESFEENSGGWISGRLGLLFQSEHPGHALARAIAEAMNRYESEESNGN